MECLLITNKRNNFYISIIFLEKNLIRIPKMILKLFRFFIFEEEIRSYGRRKLDPILQKQTNKKKIILQISEEFRSNFYQVSQS